MADVGCAGILVADTFCGPMRGLPRQGQLLALDAMPSKAGGCAANVAIDLARQGVSAEAVGCLGDDASASIVLDYFRRHGVGADRVIRCREHPTSQTVILLVEGEDRRYLHVFGANQAFGIGRIDRDWVAQLKIFYLGGLGVMPAIRTDELLDLLRFCRDRGVVTVVDVVIPHGFDAADEFETLLPHIDYFLPNDDEAAAITGRTDPVDQVRSLCAMGAKAVVLTRGEAGALAARGDELWSCGVYPAGTVDPSGSGDAFAAGVLTGILRGAEMPDLLRYASALGASATSAVGTTDGVFTGEQAQAFIQANELEIDHRTPLR